MISERHDFPDNFNHTKEFNLLYPEFPELNGLLLDRKGFSFEEGEHKLQICSDCLADLEDDKVDVPKYSYANDTFYGEIPDELKGLTLGELLCLRRYRICGTTVK